MGRIAIGRAVATGLASIVLAAGGAFAQPGKNNGNAGGNNRDAATSQQGQRGDSEANAARPANGNATKNGQTRSVQPEQQMQASSRNGGNGQGQAAGPARNDTRTATPALASQRGTDQAAANRANAKTAASDASQGKPASATRAERRDDGNGIDYVTIGQGQSRRYTRDRGDDGPRILSRYDQSIRSRGLISGCPPGLAKKANGCNPPGLVKQRRYSYDRTSWWGLPGLIDGSYRYYGGHLVRMSDGGSILGYYPLLGGALSVGNAWPSWYDADPAPSYYRSYYGLGRNYRYADNVFYRVDPQTAAITSIAALLTGDTITVGRPMPRGYSVYNVPYGYRDRFADGPDAYYRYSDGYVYQIDPETRLVAAAIELLI